MEKPISLMVALKISEYYPDDVAIIPIVDEEQGTCSAALATYRNGIQGDMLYAFEEFTHKTEQEAVDAMAIMVANTMKRIKIMSN